MTFTKANASEMGARGGRARARHLTLEQVESALGPLETEQDAKRRLERLGVWCAAGLVSGSQGGSAVRATEQWLRAHSEELDRERLHQAERRIQELEEQLAAGAAPGRVYGTGR